MDLPAALSSCLNSFTVISLALPVPILFLRRRLILIAFFRRCKAIAFLRLRGLVTKSAPLKGIGLRFITAIMCSNMLLYS